MRYSWRQLSSVFKVAGEVEVWRDDTQDRHVIRQLLACTDQSSEGLEGGAQRFVNDLSGSDDLHTFRLTLEG